MEKLLFDDFIITVACEQRQFVTELHGYLQEQGCKTEVKTAKSGYLLSYILNKKTVANYVFRKKGIMIRIYADNVNSYPKALADLPDEMLTSIEAAPICKRMENLSACNQRCPMGYDFLINDKRYQKCRNNAFMFLLTDISNPHIKAIMQSEVAARKLK